MNVTLNGLDQFYDNLQQEQTKILNDIKSEKCQELDKINYNEITIITSLLCNLLKLKKLIKDKEKL